MGFNSCRNKENPRTAWSWKKQGHPCCSVFIFFQCSVSWICVFVSPVFVWSLSWYLRFTLIYRGFVILLVKSATNKAGLHKKTWQRLNFNRHIIPFRRSNLLPCLRKVCLSVLRKRDALLCPENGILFITSFIRRPPDPRRQPSQRVTKQSKDHASSLNAKKPCAANISNFL